MCNVAYATYAEGMTAEDLEKFDEEIGMVADPADWAQDELRKHQAAMGMHFDDPDAPVVPAG
jgi:hypothetical protein